MANEILLSVVAPIIGFITFLIGRWNGIQSYRNKKNNLESSYPRIRGNLSLCSDMLGMLIQQARRDDIMDHNSLLRNQIGVFQNSFNSCTDTIRTELEIIRSMIDRKFFDNLRDVVEGLEHFSNPDSIILGIPDAVNSWVNAAENLRSRIHEQNSTIEVALNRLV